MELLINQIRKEYNIIISQGYNSKEAAERSIENVLSSKMIKPHVYTDYEGFASHVFYKGYVLFFCSGKIYKSVN